MCAESSPNIMNIFQPQALTVHSKIDTLLSVKYYLFICRDTGIAHLQQIWGHQDRNLK